MNKQGIRNSKQEKERHAGQIDIGNDYDWEQERVQLKGERCACINSHAHLRFTVYPFPDKDEPVS